MPNQEVYDSWTEHGKKATQKLDMTMSTIRQEQRSTWSQIILLTSAILGFSATFITLKFSLIPVIILISSWSLFAITLILGVWLLIKDNRDYLTAQTKQYLFTQDDVDRETKYAKGTINKEKYDALFVALMYLRSPDRSFFSQKAKETFEKNNEDLSSWKLIKDPEKFYFGVNGWRDFQNKCITENSLFVLFAVSTITLLLGLVLTKFI